jgi:hypothetical protein
VPLPDRLVVLALVFHSTPFQLQRNATGDVRDAVIGARNLNDEVPLLKAGARY